MSEIFNLTRRIEINLEFVVRYPNRFEKSIQQLKESLEQLNNYFKDSPFKDELDSILKDEGYIIGDAENLWWRK